jgi:hypothetical protein|tara:strand:- start:252 stop:1049 length:798 start_codon:yes stop_codon:yes gene_type:complete
MAEEFDRIEKALEGNGLALSAVAEVLQKMDARLIKAEADDEERREEEDDAVEKAALVKELAAEVAGILKADQGMDVDGSTERKAKTTGGSSGKADDSESAANISSKIEQQQNTIQAMRKADEEDEDEDDMDKADTPDDNEEDEDATKAMKYKADDDDDEDDDEMKSMQKELDSLRKQLASFEQGIDKSVEEASEARLRKMGFREERGLVAPQITALGTDGTTPIVKSATEGDTVDQLANLSYGELRALQLKIQAGDTAGVPQELL